MIKILQKVLICSVVLISGCDTLGRWKSAGADVVLKIIPRSVDKSLGEIAEKSQTLGKEKSVPEEARLHLNKLAEPLMSLVSIPPLEMKLEVVQSNLPNAFAFPHGRIAVTSKLVEISQAPEEILAVIAHELAHVSKRHSMQQIVSQLGTVLLVNLLFGDLGGLAELAETGGQLLGLKFSRDHEREADALGVDLLRKAELPLNGVSGFFQRMAEFEKAVAVTSEAGKLMSILSTHPATEERIEFALKLVSDPNSKTPAAQQDAYRKLKSVFK